jgi:glycosyltransferase involved in cell wall biosynthesis
MDRKISVAMATCNGEKFIAKQLGSILAQSVVPNEIIICDDSRNKSTFRAIQLLIATFPRIIKYYHNDTQLGVSKNFEKAVSLCSGNIIFLSDQDDVWQTDKIEILSALIDNSGLPSGAFCDSALVNESLMPLGRTHWELRGFTPDLLRTDAFGQFAIFCRRVPPTGHNMAFSAELKDVLLPFPTLQECHDTWIGLVIAATSGWSLSNKKLTLWRQHSANVSQTDRRSQLQEALESIKNNTFQWNAILFEELFRRLSESTYRIETGIMELIRDRCEHSAARAKMQCNIFKRIPLILGEIINRRYFQYARGWKSVFQDYVLRMLVR